MRGWIAAAAVGTAALLAGCGTAPPKGSAEPAAAVSAVPASAPARAPATTTAGGQAVRVPAASAKKVVLNMTGAPAALNAKDWASFKEEWRSTFAEHAKGAGIAFELQRGDARPTAEPGTLLNVYVNDYRQVGIGARIFFGVMTGNAYIDARIAFADLSNGAAFGEQAYNTSSSAWSGVFAKMTPQQVDAIAAEVFRELRTP